MAAANTECSIFEEDQETFSCAGCSRYFCFEHLAEHREILNTQLQQIQDDYNQFRQTLIDQRENPQKHPSIQIINRWEEDSINKIKQKAQQFREKLTNYTNKIISQIEMTLNDPKEQPISTDRKKKFNEIHLDQFTKNLQKLKKEFNKPKGISIEKQSASPINKLVVSIPVYEGNIIPYHYPN